MSLLPRSATLRNPRHISTIHLLLSVFPLRAAQSRFRLTFINNTSSLRQSIIRPTFACKFNSSRKLLNSQEKGETTRARAYIKSTHTRPIPRTVPAHISHFLGWVAALPACSGPERIPTVGLRMPTLQPGHARTPPYLGRRTGQDLPTWGQHTEANICTSCHVLGFPDCDPAGPGLGRLGISSCSCSFHQLLSDATSTSSTDRPTASPHSYPA